MMPQQFCLRWKYHHSNLQTMFSQLLDRGCFCDVTIACEGQLLRAHRMVLCACSTYFDSILSSGRVDSKDPIILMRDCRFEDIKCLVDFMYRGEINVEHSNIASLLKTATDLCIKGLAEVAWRDDLVSGRKSVSGGGGISTSPSHGPHTASNRFNASSGYKTTATHAATQQSHYPAEIIQRPLSSSSLGSSSRQPPDHHQQQHHNSAGRNSSSAYNNYNQHLNTAVSNHPNSSSISGVNSGNHNVQPHRLELRQPNVSSACTSSPIVPPPIKRKRGRPPLDAEFDSYSAPKITHVECGPPPPDAFCDLPSPAPLQQHQQQDASAATASSSSPLKAAASQMSPATDALHIVETHLRDDDENGPRTRDDDSYATSGISDGGVSRGAVDASEEIDVLADLEPTVSLSPPHNDGDGENSRGSGGDGHNDKCTPKAQLKDNTAVADDSDREDSAAESNTNFELNPNQNNETNAPSCSESMSTQNALTRQRFSLNSWDESHMQMECDEGPDTLVGRLIPKIERPETPDSEADGGLLQPMLRQPTDYNDDDASEYDESDEPILKSKLKTLREHERRYRQHQEELLYQRHLEQQQHQRHQHHPQQQKQQHHQHQQLMMKPYNQHSAAGSNNEYDDRHASSSSAASRFSMQSRPSLMQLPSTSPTIGGGGGGGMDGNSSMQHQDLLTPQEILEWSDVVKLNDYLRNGRRPHFWEESFTLRVMEAIKNKSLEMKKAAFLLGVSYGTLYGRYRETYGCLKHSFRSPSSLDSSVWQQQYQTRRDLTPIVCPMTKQMIWESNVLPLPPGQEHSLEEHNGRMGAPQLQPPPPARTTAKLCYDADERAFSMRAVIGESIN